MATYAELFSLFQDTGTRNKVEVAIVIAAQKILDGTISETAPTTKAQLNLWASRALDAPRETARLVWMYVLAKNTAATVQQIQTATDVAVQDNVEAAVNALAGTLTP